MTVLRFIKYPLLPILIPQGLWAKWRTPRLAEAQGERSGIIGQGKIIRRLLVLGDSAAAGVGVDHQQHALIGQLLQRFDLTQYQINWQLHAKSGNTLNDSLQLLKSLPIQHFDFVIISSGVNDILQQHSIQKWQKNYTEIYHYLSNYCGQPQILFSQVPPLQHFSALPKQLAWYLGLHAKSFNQNVEKQSDKLNHLHYIPITLPISPEYLARDGFHPSALSYTIWAEQLIQYLHTEQLL